MLHLLPFLSDDLQSDFTSPPGWEPLSLGDDDPIPSYFADRVSRSGYRVIDEAEALRLSLGSDRMGVLTIGERRFFGFFPEGFSDEGQRSDMAYE